MKTYLLNFPRPTGIEPRVYFKWPVSMVSVPEDYYGPSVLEFDTVEEALKHIIRFNNTDEYLSQITFEEIPE